MYQGYTKGPRVHLQGRGAGTLWHVLLFYLHRWSQKSGPSPEYRARSDVLYQYTMTVYIRSSAEPSAVIHGRLIQSCPRGWRYMHRICTFRVENASEASLLLSAQLPPKPYLMSRSSQFNRPCYLFHVYIFCNLIRNEILRIK